MRAIFLLSLALILSSVSVIAQTNEKTTLRIIESSDVHGNYFPYDFVEKQPMEGGLSRIATYVDEQRKLLSEKNVLLLDNGDILQGQPTAYYYNFIATGSRHVCAGAMNYIGYDAATIGNHDIETGHSVYDRWTLECNFPVLCANAIDTRTGFPYWKPYAIFERGGVRIAVLGMITPSIPKWLPQNLWKGMVFEDIVACARRWMPTLRDKEKADVIVGLFHSGIGSSDQTGSGNENAALQVAREVPGFDIIFCGHDHRASKNIVKNSENKEVLVINPGSNGKNVAQADITLSRKVEKRISGEIVSLANIQPQPAYIKDFAPQAQEVKIFTEKKIGSLSTTLSSRDAFFGPSAFINLIQQMQLQLTGADISFAAPLSFDTRIEAGDITISDMFKLYHYENYLYTMLLKGSEIKDYLEYSYDGWVNTMHSANDTMIAFRQNPMQYAEGWQRLRTPSYNFDCAAGIDYIVHLDKPKGQRVEISQMSNGIPFSPDSIYSVAINSYRGNGGGNLLTKGAGIPKEELPQRILRTTDRDLRYYLMQLIESTPEVRIETPTNWKFVPEEWAKTARNREERLLFK